MSVIHLIVSVILPLASHYLEFMLMRPVQVHRGSDENNVSFFKTVDPCQQHDDTLVSWKKIDT